MSKTRLVAGMATAISALVPAAIFAAPASAAEETSPEISWVKENVIVSGANGDQAVIQAKYRCSGQGVHLWASVKQGPGVDEEHTSSADADAWYETPEGPAPTCDGKTHVEQFTVTRAEGWDQLVTGRGWVQFVFFYIDGTGTFRRAADVGWAEVKAPNGH